MDATDPRELRRVEAEVGTPEGCDQRGTLSEPHNVTGVVQLESPRGCGLDDGSAEAVRWSPTTEDYDRAVRSDDGLGWEDVTQADPVLEREARKVEVGAGAVVDLDELVVTEVANTFAIRIAGIFSLKKTL